MSYVICSDCIYFQGGQCHRHAPRPLQLVRSATEPYPIVELLWPMAWSGCGEGEEGT